jgi:hypothetical protein
MELSKIEHPEAKKSEVNPFQRFADILGGKTEKKAPPDLKGLQEKIKEPFSPLMTGNDGVKLSRESRMINASHQKDPKDGAKSLSPQNQKDVAGGAASLIETVGPATGKALGKAAGDLPIGMFVSAAMNDGNVNVNDIIPPGEGPLFNMISRLMPGEIPGASYEC